MRRVRKYVDARDVVALLGAALVVVGLAQVYPPAAYIVPGLGLIALAAWRVK